MKGRNYKYQRRIQDCCNIQDEALCDKVKGFHYHKVLHLGCCSSRRSASEYSSLINYTAQKMKFTIKDFFSKCDQICSFLRIWSHLLKESLMENFVFSAVLQWVLIKWRGRGVQVNYPNFMNPGGAFRLPFNDNQIIQEIVLFFHKNSKLSSPYNSAQNR